MGPLQVLLWIAEHWWILAIVAVTALGATLWSGVVQLGVVVAALTKLLAEIIRFFSTQTAEKILFGFVCVTFALSVGFYHGQYKTNAKWERREAARAAAAEKLRTKVDQEQQSQVTAAQTAEDADAAAAKQRINAYALTLPKALPDECRLTAADLAAAGVPDVGRRGAKSNPGKVQSPLKPGPSR